MGLTSCWQSDGLVGIKRRQSSAQVLSWVDLRPGEIDARKLPLRQRKAFGWPLWDSRATRGTPRTKLADLLDGRQQTGSKPILRLRAVRKWLANLPGPTAYPTWSWVKIRGGMAAYGDAGGRWPGRPPGALSAITTAGLWSGPGEQSLERRRPAAPCSATRHKPGRTCERCKPGAKTHFQKVAAFAGRVVKSGRTKAELEGDSFDARAVRRVLKAIQAPPARRGRPPKRRHGRAATHRAEAVRRGR